MSHMISFARNHQLSLFFVLACAFSWWPWVWQLLGPDQVDGGLLPVGPFLAAGVMLALVGGRLAIREWIRKIVHWRVAPVWYALALLGPPALTFGAVAINIAAGATLVPEWMAPGPADLAVQFVIILLFIGLGEEPAWRGYALPRLMPGATALTAALLLGLLHALWHLPLFGVEYDVANGAPWAISVLCLSVVIAWMWLHTGGSLLLPMLLHAANNTASFVRRGFDGPDQLRLWWIWAGLWVAAAAIVVVVNGFDLTRRVVATPAPEPTDRPARRSAPDQGKLSS